MSSTSNRPQCEHTDAVAAYALHALPAEEAASLEAHLAACSECRQELESLRGVVGTFASWPTDVLRSPDPLWDRIAQRLPSPSPSADAPAPAGFWSEPQWEEVAPGISCKLLATDRQRNMVSMLVRLAPNTHYPPHLHAGLEELHLLDGELWINEDKLFPGDYSRAEAGTADHRVWSETGCTCVLMTSTRDELR